MNKMLKNSDVMQHAVKVCYINNNKIRGFGGDVGFGYGAPSRRRAIYLQSSIVDDT